MNLDPARPVTYILQTQDVDGDDWYTIATYGTTVHDWQRAEKTAHLLQSQGIPARVTTEDGS